MWRGGCGAQDVSHLDAAGGQGISNQLAVALPPFRFRAHDGDASLPGKSDQRPEVPFEDGSLHVIGIATEPFIFPTAVWRIATWFAEPS